MRACVCVQEDLRIALCQGSRLLESINEPLVKDPDYTMNHDELENLATVQRCVCVCVCVSESPSVYRAGMQEWETRWLQYSSRLLRVLVRFLQFIKLFRAAVFLHAQDDPPGQH